MLLLILFLVSLGDRLASKWDDRTGGGDWTDGIDWSKPLPRDENLEKKLFSGSNTGTNLII